MNLNPIRWLQGLKDWRDRQREARRKAFEAGQAISGEEYHADLLADLVEAKKRGLSALMSGLDEAGKYDDSDEVTRELVAAYKDDLIAMAGLTRIILRPDSPEVRKEASENAFFDSTGSSAGLPTDGPRALPGVPDARPSEPPKPRRGRPPGSKTRRREPPATGGATNGDGHA